MKPKTKIAVPAIIFLLGAAMIAAAALRDEAGRKDAPAEYIGVDYINTNVNENAGSVDDDTSVFISE